MLHWTDGAVVSRELHEELLTSSALLPSLACMIIFHLSRVRSLSSLLKRRFDGLLLLSGRCAIAFILSGPVETVRDVILLSAASGNGYLTMDATGM